MSNVFLQLHFLTPYAPSNLNRDDLGRPKTALFGGSQRLRVSSQSLKRAWRTSDVFETELAEHIGTRTKRFGDLVLPILTKVLDEKKAKKLASRLAEQFGAVKDEGLRTEQLAHITPEEKRHLEALAGTLASEGGREPSKEELEKLVGHIRELRDRGVTFLIVEHNMSLVMNLCDALVVLDYGEKIAEGPPRAIRDDERVIEAYFGR